MLISKFFKNNLKVKLISIEMIINSKYKVRDYQDDKTLESLSQNIKEYGVLSPILVKKLENDMFEIISGHRRFLATQKAGIKKIPVIIVNEINNKLPIYFLSENLYRNNLNFFEEARAIFKLIDEYNFSQEMISSSLGVDQSFITDRLKILKLSKKVQDKIILYDINIKFAVLISKLEKESDQLVIIEEFINNNLNLKQIQNIIERYKNKNFGLLDYKKMNSETIYIVKDFRLFDNTISEAINIMKKSGLEALSVKSENSEFIEYKIKIPKNKVYIKKSSGF